MQNLTIKETNTSPTVIINFSELLFEISGVSLMDEPSSFYEQIFSYIDTHYYQVVQSIYQRTSPQLTLHFYMKQIGPADMQMFRKIDKQFSEIGEFTTYVYWYYNPNKEDSVLLADEVEKTFINPTRLIPNSVHV
jgi:hypothetical protein